MNFMNWAKFQTYNDAPTKAFEVLCNQLFENWCREKYKAELVSFYIVNGAGGDGGVESYAVLSDGKIVGLQAKWFPESINSNQISQIKNSIKTALKIRPEIAHYVVCIPRDLASLTERGTNTEEDRWEKMKSEVLQDYPDLVLDLWNETRLTQELQKEANAGIYKFWFMRSEISEECVRFSFEKSKESWLKTKYIPDLNAYGIIDSSVSAYLGDVDQRRKLNEHFTAISNLCNEFYMKSDELLKECGEEGTPIKSLLDNTKSQIQAMHHEVERIRFWLNNESGFNITVNTKLFFVDCDFIMEQLKESDGACGHYFAISDVTKVLQRLCSIPIQHLLDQIRHANDYRSLIFLGEPGTGKTHGAAAEVEKLLNNGYHVPILIQARDIPATATWKEIIISSLGLDDSWSEEEIWQGLSSLASRKKFHALDGHDHVVVLPKIIIMVDGVDESSSHDKWIERAQETNAIVPKYPAIRFCFMSRPHVFDGKDNCGRTININPGGDVAVCKLFDSYARAYKINTDNAEWVKYGLTTPLALKLFCEINEGKTITYHSDAGVSIADLLKEKINTLEKEYCKQDSNSSVADQNILHSILLLANLFSNESGIERSKVINAIAQKLSIAIVRSQKLVKYLESYGILHLYCKPGNGLLSPDTYIYQPGIQGYFDYASALTLIEENRLPQNIDFNKCRNLPRNAYYLLAIISIQRFSYLIVDNTSIGVVIDEPFKDELLCFALRHTKPAEAAQYKVRLFQLMSNNANTLKKIVNNLVLPLARIHDHPLSVALINEFLLSFEYPAQRDILWSVPSHLKSSKGERWYSNSELELNQDAYSLTSVDIAEGLPTVYAWALSSIDNTRRQMYRDELMGWALKTPKEFYKLFLKFSFVNDPQIRSDVFAILMSLIFENENIELLQEASNWLMENILSPQKIDDNRDIAIRYYSTSIIRKAISAGVITSESAAKYLPPFQPTSNKIALSEKALGGTCWGGYLGVSYSLGKYVLINHITTRLPDYGEKTDEQYERLIKDIVKDQPQFAGISLNQLILSAAFEFIAMCGWSEKEFCSSHINKENMGGVDLAISCSYLPETHGSQSSVMTICEKYVWQARNYISGFLADRLLYMDDIEGPSYVSDYGLLDNFLIPALEIEQSNPENMNDLYPWHIPEKDSVILSGKPTSKEDIITTVREAPNIVWEKWIQLDNSKHQYPLDGNRLIALSGFSCFESPAEIETNLYFTSVLISENDLDCFVSTITKNIDLSYRITNPQDWKSGICTDCDTTPKELCWMPWKIQYASWFTDEFPALSITSAVDTCTYNFLKYGDVSYDLPSVPIRKFLGITNTDGYEFYNEEKEIKAINVLAGEKWRTQQRQLLVDSALLTQAKENGKVLVWIMREQRRENSVARKEFGDFYVEKDCSHIGFFQNDNFVVMKIPFKEPKAVDRDDILDESLAQYE